MQKGRDCGHNNDAIKFYEKAIEINPKCWRAYNNMGLCYKELGDKVKALELLNKAIEIEPNSPILYTNRGNLFDDLKNMCWLCLANISDP